MYEGLDNFERHEDNLYEYQYYIFIFYNFV